MEDSGTLQALTQLSRAGKADVKRVLVLRTASNYSMPPPGKSPVESLLEHKPGSYSGYKESLDAAHRVGSVVVKELLKR
jgi:purine nucleoside permease